MKDADQLAAEANKLLRHGGGKSKDEFNISIIKSAIEKATVNLKAKEQVLYDIHHALGVKWGDDPYAMINKLKTRAAHASKPTNQIAAEAAEQIETDVSDVIIDKPLLVAIIKSAIEKATERYMNEMKAATALIEAQGLTIANLESQAQGSPEAHS